jgi:hypothetical protein
MPRTVHDPHASGIVVHAVGQRAAVVADWIDRPTGAMVAARDPGCARGQAAPALPASCAEFAGLPCAVYRVSFGKFRQNAVNAV